MSTITITVNADGQAVGMLLAEPKAFKTGSKGFYAQGKVVTPDGKRYQAQVQLVEIGSKPPSPAGK